MRKRKLGNSGLEISVIGLGTWAIGGWMWGGQNESDSIDAITEAVKNGVNWIDTAPIYGGGLSEVVVGKAIRQLPLHLRPYIFSKFGMGDDVDNIVVSASSSEIISECEKSLERLKVDTIDCYQLHWPVKQSLEEVAKACEKLMLAGKIRSIGVCNFSVEQSETWLKTGVPLHSIQNPYSILRPAMETDVLPWCAKHSTGALAYSSLLRGMLVGNWNKNKTFPKDDGRSSHKDYSGKRFELHLDATKKLSALGESVGLSCAQISIASILATPGLTSAIVGARNGTQGRELAKLDCAISPEMLANVVQVMDDLFFKLKSL